MSDNDLEEVMSISVHASIESKCALTSSNRSGARVSSSCVNNRADKAAAAEAVVEGQTAKINKSNKGLASHSLCLDPYPTSKN